MSDNEYKELFETAKLDPSVKERIEKKIFGLQFQFEVGETEKHIVEFLYNYSGGKVVIRVDGRIFISKVYIAWIKRERTFEFTIGNTEKHDIRINMIRSGFPAGARKFTVWAFADKKLMGQHDGDSTFTGREFKSLSTHKKILIITPFALIAAFWIFNILYSIIPSGIDVDMNGVLIRAGTSEPEYCQPINIKISGKYYKRISFRSPYWFEGSTHVYELKDNAASETQQEKSKFGIYLGVPLIEGYVDPIRSFGHSLDGGFFYLKPDKSALMIIVFEKDENGETGHAGGADGLYYVAPCSTREEAIEIINELRPMIYRKDVTPVE